MTDVQSVLTPRRRPVPKPGHPKKLPAGVPLSASPRVLAAIRYMVHGSPHDGLPIVRAEAAKLAGITDVTLRAAFRNPLVVKAYNHELEVLRTSERARNLHAAVSIRDDAKMAKSAAGNGVRLHAARFIEGRDGPASVQVNVGLNVTPGYQIAMPSELADAGRQMLKLSGSHANVLDMQADVPTDDEGTR